MPSEFGVINLCLKTNYPLNSGQQTIQHSSLSQGEYPALHCSPVRYVVHLLTGNLINYFSIFNKSIELAPPLNSNEISFQACTIGHWNIFCHALTVPLEWVLLTPQHPLQYPKNTDNNLTGWPLCLKCQHKKEESHKGIDWFVSLEEII